MTTYTIKIGIHPPASGASSRRASALTVATLGADVALDVPTLHGLARVTLTPAECGALLFALERSCEALEQVQLAHDGNPEPLRLPH